MVCGILMLKFRVWNIPSSIQRFKYSQFKLLRYRACKQKKNGIENESRTHRVEQVSNFNSFVWFPIASSYSPYVWFLFVNSCMHFKNLLILIVANWKEIVNFCYADEWVRIDFNEFVVINTWSCSELLMLCWRMSEWKMDWKKSVQWKMWTQLWCEACDTNL